MYISVINFKNTRIHFKDMFFNFITVLLLTRSFGNICIKKKYKWICFCYDRHPQGVTGDTPRTS